MKMETFAIALTWLATIAAFAQLNVSPSGGRGGGSSSSHVTLGGHHYHHGGAYFYGDYWWGYPYYYSYGYYGHPGYSHSPSSLGKGYSPSGASYEDLGRFCGKNFKQGKSTRQQFIAFLQTDLLKAADPAAALFEKEFVKSYGKEGRIVLQQSLDEAKAGMPANPQPSATKDSAPATPQAPPASENSATNTPSAPKSRR